MRALIVTMLMAALVAGCNGGTDSLTASPVAMSVGTRPTVTAVAPVNGATGVAINSSIVSVAFSEQMAAINGAASFTVTCAAPCTNPAGTLALDTAGTSATFRLAAGATLAPMTLYTATVTGASSAAGLAMANPYTWQFTTGASLDLTRPQVTLTLPITTTPGPTAGAAANAAITAAFTEGMDPVSITASSFTVTCASPCASPTGTVSYSVGNRTATFAPAAALTVGALYTATITTAATDTAGNALAGNQTALPAASNYLWSFTSAAAAPAADVTVASTNPANAVTGVCPDASVNATFAVPSGLPMDPNSLNSATFTVTGPSPATTSITAASVVLDAATGHVATFTPQAALSAGGTYTATVLGGASGVKDLALPADGLATSVSWSFTVGAAGGTCFAPPVLGSVAPYGTFGGSAGMTNTGILTVINGDIGTIATTSSSITGFHDTAGDIYTESPADIGTVNGMIDTCTNSTTGPTSTAPNAAACTIATQSRLDAQSAYLALAGMPAGANPGGNLAGLTLAPGVYTAPGGSFEIQGADLTLDAQGNANAVWVFQMASTLTVGGPGAAAPESVILAGGAQAKNVFWQVGSAATINAAGGGTMVGTIIAQAGAAFSTVGNTTIVTLDGRVLSLGASVTVVDTVINIPAP
jgi:hypothetical protein